MMSSQLKHRRSLLWGLPVMRFDLGMTRRRPQRSEMWKTSLSSAQVGGISGGQVLVIGEGDTRLHQHPIYAVLRWKGACIVCGDVAS